MRHGIDGRGSLPGSPRLPAPVRQDAGARPVETDLSLSMGAMGVKGVVLSTAATELSLRLGWRFALGQRLSLRLEGERVESGHAPTDHSLVLRTSLPW